MFNGVSNVQDFGRFLDDMLKLSFRSRYMTELYQAKKEKNRYLTQEEEKDYLLHCSILDVTSDLFADVYKNFISTANISEDQRYLEYAHAHEKGVIWNKYSFGAVDTNKMKKNLTNLQYNAMNIFDQNKKVVMQELLGMGLYDMMKKVEGLEKTFTPDEKRAFLDKAMLTFAHNTSNSFHPNVTSDKEWSKQVAVKYNLGDPDKFVSSMLDYQELLAQYGIDMGELPKTFVSEGVVEPNYGRSSSRR